MAAQSPFEGHSHSVQVTTLTFFKILQKIFFSVSQNICTLEKQETR